MPLSPNESSSTGAGAPSAASPTRLVHDVHDTHDWTCPFCPLLCDDLTVSAQGDGTLAVSGHDCPRLAQALATFGASDATTPAIVDGQDASLDAALSRAATLLGAARRPLFGGLATDVAGARALYTLAAQCGATLDHLHGDALTPATLAFQDRGAFFTTLSEVRARADLIVFFACTPSQRYPRFFTRALGGTSTARELVFVGCAPDPAATGLTHTQSETLLANADPFDTLAIWSALANGRRPETLSAEARAAANALAALQARIAAARYTVFVYEPAALPHPHAALLIEALNRIAKAANLTTRAGCLPLGGDDGALTVNQAVTWLSGLPLRLRVSAAASQTGGATLDYDPYRYRTETLLAANEADALLWVASFGPHGWPSALTAGVPAVVLGHPALAEAAKARGAATVFIPVATPGIDGTGHLFRVDSSVVVPLAAARGAALPSVHAVATQLHMKLAAEHGVTQAIHQTAPADGEAS
ncbi:formylmethanofuran dehydrogenase [Paraburkholderia kururiensis]|uniref:Formylmethanofuran dehydrogenase n=1 Tax=Paraburkholderia kururiensis TaxID=984307 RepID=A0ABZ0WMI9_9BURK|nr:formylmethanofuran dehydrogenase [Paraburkholderia kururiensis]WQD78583.1 formylmethanofuran dehydrogenase [Paraburkholderia kururiensis]